MFLESIKEGTVLRVRLTPNSSSCKVLGEHDGYLKISVVSIPEKGKANEELIKFLAKILKTAKSNLKIIHGELDKYKKILIVDKTLEDIEEKLNGSKNY